MKTLQQIEEMLNAEIASGAFKDEDIQSFDEWAICLATTFLNQSNVSWTAKRIGNITLFKLDTDYLKYLVAIPDGNYVGQDRDVFFWSIGQDFKDENCIMPNVATAWLLRHCSGLDVRFTEYGSEVEFWEFDPPDEC